MSDLTSGMTDLDDMEDIEMIMQQLQYEQSLQEQESESSHHPLIVCTGNGEEWHGQFAREGANNDITILNNYPLFDDRPYDIASLAPFEVEEGRGECSGGGVVDRSGGEWWENSWREKRTNGACLLLGKVEEGRANAMEVGEKRMAGNSGLNATVLAKLAGKKTLLLGLWDFDNPPVACLQPGKVEQFRANAMEVVEWAGMGEKRMAGISVLNATVTAIQTGKTVTVTSLGF
uniref:Uncharacterized protein n=1 Tax=Tanacetum cinerariifolium TaxID=118510 RepID=A0A6L2MAH7_TANCI|nr:hypothetical protein [Tanacetum cinerariifolium]